MMNARKLMISAVLGLLAALTALAGPASAGAAAVKVDKPEITSDAVWSGSVEVKRRVTVKAGVTLSIKPGTRVSFAREAGLDISGTLDAQGGERSVISFGPDTDRAEPGYWAGISFTNPDAKPSSLRYVRISGAQAVMVTAGKPSIRNCEITGGVSGISAQSRKSAPVIRDNRINGMSAGGIDCQKGSSPEILGNTIERCLPFGISASQESYAVIKGNAVRECGDGMRLNQFATDVEDNQVIKNAAGIVAILAGKDLALRRNKVADNGIGIICRQYSSPLIERNDITGNKQGIVCFMASSPLIRNNRFTGNDEGISCIQLCNPHITANEIRGNGKGLYLDLSSYATINGNNITGNKVQVELGNMSSDWERRVNQKPVRGSEAQSMTRAQRGVSPDRPADADTEIMGYVDATGNWWGDTVTREMAKKGPEANIDSFIDYYDVPIRTYEGYEGEYVQDRIRYEGWKSSMIKGAGL